MIKTITPRDGSLYVERNYANLDNIEESLNKSKKAFEIWKNTKLSERKKIISKFVENFLKNYKEIENELCMQMGRPISQC